MIPGLTAHESDSADIAWFGIDSYAA